MTAVPAWWIQVEGPSLSQGDYLPRCLVPLFAPDYGAETEIHDVSVKEYDCIVVTQSCDLENDKASLVALCPMWTISQFEEANPAFKKIIGWEPVRRRRVEGLHLLASQETPSDNRGCLVTDFRDIYSLPIAYLKKHAQGLGHRWRLQSPYLEHFSQAFARFFMRVGLPSAVPPFKK
jgi:hypothetical protein